MMRCAAKQSYLPRSKMVYLQNMQKGTAGHVSAADSEKAAAGQVDGNIVQVSLGSLAEPKVFASGDPFRCARCASYFSIHSVKNVVNQGGEKVWNCEFCGNRNKLTLDPEEYPKTEVVSYLLGGGVPVPAHPASLTEEVKATAPAPSKESPIVIFCIDCSGSMDTPKQKPEPAPRNMFMQRMIVPAQPSRLRAVQYAVRAELLELAKESPELRVGLITFSDSVSLIGDGTQMPVKLDNKYMRDFFGMVEHASNFGEKYLSRPVKYTSQNLITGLEGLQTGNYTALGPALVAAVALASKGAAGSKVIICTDGLANKGLGSIGKTAAQQAEAKKFYTEVGYYAQQKSTMVSVISLVEAECRLDLLSPIAGLTGGDVVRIDPTLLGHGFGAMVREQTVATQVSVKVKLHRILRFAGVPEEYLSTDGSLYTQAVGNAHADAAVTCRYTMRPIAELQDMAKDIDYMSIKSLPLQLQVEFRSLEGKMCVQVQTKLVECTEEKKEAKMGLDTNILKTYSAQAAAKYAGCGRYSEAVSEVHALADLPEEAEQKKAVEHYAAEMTGAIKKQVDSKGTHQLDVLSCQINQAMRNAKQF